MNKLTTLILLFILFPWNAIAKVHQVSDTTARMKTWWFFGYENTTDEGIHADIQALKEAGFGGVVYYDQNHRQKNQEGPKPEEGFSAEWWRHLKLAAREAHAAGLSFELNISNGYVAGGRWIDPKHAMQRVASAKSYVEGGRKVVLALPEITGPENYVRDIALVALPMKGQGQMRHLTARYAPKGKGPNGAMQGPLEGEGFTGYGFKALPYIGELQASEDSLHWQKITELENFYSSQGAYPYRTTAFPATEAKYFGIGYTGTVKLRSWQVGSEALEDRWEEKCGLQCDFIGQDQTPDYPDSVIVKADEIIDLSPYIAGDSLTWEAPAGQWCILRLAAVLTGAKSKHGRENLLGYECDKLSKEAATLHWNSYMQVILDSLQADHIDWVEGVTMDSHEGGSQNWTSLFLDEFEQRRGYSLRPYLPIFAGYIIDSRASTEQHLRDIRLTLSDCIRDNYYGTFQRLATERGLHFTAQAIGNALCIEGDAISVKKAVEKPQGEFWAYQQKGAYDVKDCSSAAHLYGKPIASAEAMTDAEYKDSPLDLKRVADIAFAMGAQEFVVCATPHIPDSAAGESSFPLKKNTGRIFGREYAINRSNPKWEEFKPIWEQINKTMSVLQQGKAAPDVLIYLGDDIPVKTLTHRLPKGIDELDWDVCTGDALLTRIEATADGQLTTPDSVRYKALIIEDSIYISPASQQKIEALRQAGVPILKEGSSVVRPLVIDQGKEQIVHTHRKIEGKDVFFIANISTEQVQVKYHFALFSRSHRLTLQPGESTFIVKK